MVIAVNNQNKKHGVGRISGFIAEDNNRDNYYQKSDKYVLDDYKSISERLKTPQKSNVKISAENRKISQTEKNSIRKYEVDKYGNKKLINTISKSDKMTANSVKASYEDKEAAALVVQQYNENLQLEGANRGNSRNALKQINSGDKLEDYLNKLK